MADAKELKRERRIARILARKLREHNFRIFTSGKAPDKPIKKDN
jgi:hypothetical protein